MKTLKTENGKKTVLRSFETAKELNDFRLTSLIELRSVLFRGTKTELLQKDDSFWKPLVGFSAYGKNNGSLNCFRDYKNRSSLFLFTLTAKESGLSSLEGEGEYVLITSESI